MTVMNVRVQKAIYKESCSMASLQPTTRNRPSIASCVPDDPVGEVFAADPR